MQALHWMYQYETPSGQGIKLMRLLSLLGKVICPLVLSVVFALAPAAGLSEITVDEDCSLHDAIKAANSDRAVAGCAAGSGHDTIVLTMDVAARGMLPPVRSDITIQGGDFTLTGNKRDRLLQVVTGKLEISHMTLTGGKRADDAGGAIRIESNASLAVSDSVFLQNEAHAGGAILNRGTLHVHNSQFIQNTATYDGGAIENVGGLMDFDETVFKQNSARNGGAIHDREGYITARGTQFSDNSARSRGGGLYTYHSVLTINDSAFRNNSAGSRGGAIALSHAIAVIIHSEFMGNFASSAGAISVNEGSVSIRESLISDNRSSGDGGGILSRATDFVMSRTTVSGNRAGRGGGLFTDEGDATILASSFDHNRSSTDGGAIWSVDADLEASDSTFYGNRAAGKGGGLFVGNYSMLTHLSIVNNWANRGGGIALDTGIVHLRNSLLAANRWEDCSGEFRQNANVNNLIADGSCDPMLQGDPQLLGLWGSPASFVISRNSPAVDAGSHYFCTESDQTGWDRKQGDSCDLGAFEVHPLRTVLPGAEQDPAAGIIVNEACSLAVAIEAANRDWALYGCPAGRAGADTITLTHDIRLEDSLPPITSEITIEGGGHTISGGHKTNIFVVADGTLTVNDLTMTDGWARSGGAIYSTGGKIILNRSVVKGNRVEGEILADGGGIYCFPCTLIINDSKIANNRSDQKGGGIAMHALGEGNTLQIRNSVIDGNSARNGGGLHIGGPGSPQGVVISNSTVSNNDATVNGGGILANLGFAHSGFDINNSTIVANRAVVGGGIYTADHGLTKLTHVTVAANEAESGGGIYTQDEGRTQLRFSLVSGNSGNDCVGFPRQNIGNFIADGTCDPALEGDPMLGQLVRPDDGGAGYYLPRAGSPVIDAAVDEYCIGADQIGRQRPQGAACDIGAIEFPAGASPEA